ncbi:hypothetical protein G7054_g1830 [Neopestalotiopsis clavispora]|nr:hypothetical protein G7054_g1830 [Neopestalotiopsis clavispora]
MATPRYTRVGPATPSGQATQLKLTTKSQAGSGKPGRPYIRALVGALVPLAITVYFWVIWRLYLDPPPTSNGLAFGRPGGSVIYYTWFVIATLGLNISRYGLEGIQQIDKLANQTPTRHAKRKQRAWTRPIDWIYMLGSRLFHGKQQHIQSHSNLWYGLAITTVFGFIGLPLSGLAMNFGNGYYASSDHPLVVGFNNDSWNERFKASVSQRTFADWSTGVSLTLPNLGVIYSNPDTDRSELSHLESLPNTLPNDTGVLDLFLSPQALNPVNGTSWGLRFSYNCSVVTTLNEFTILNSRQNRNASSNPGSSTYTVNGGNSSIQVWDETDDTVKASFANNIEAFAEIGWDEENQSQQETRGPPPASECYNPIPLGSGSVPYPGLSQPQMLEIALWQNLSSKNLDVENPPVIDNSLANTIPELLGAHNGTQGPMAAVGVQCSSVSEVGTARIDGRLSTFADFRRSNSTPKGGSGLRCAERLSLGVPNLLFATALASNSNTSEWLSPFFASAGKFPQSYVQNDYMWVGNQINLQSSLLQADELKNSLLRAYSLYSLALVYNSGVGYVDGNGTYVAASFMNQEALTYVEDTILIPGIVPPAVAVVLLTLWALGSLILSVLYGFRKR